MGSTSLLDNRPVIWRGCLAMKTHQLPIQLHFLSGNSSFPIACLPYVGIPDARLLTISQVQKMREENLISLSKRLKVYNEHCVLIGLPDASNTFEKYRLAQQLKCSFVDYLNVKKGVGIAYLYERGNEEETFTLHVFPNCEFAENLLSRLVPEHSATLQHTAYVLFVIVKSSE